MATNYPVLPTLQSQTTAARQQGLDMGLSQMNAAQTAQNIRNMEATRQINLQNLKEAQRNEQLNSLKRANAEWEERLKSTPQVRSMFQQQVITDAANKLSESKKVQYQNALDTLDPVVTEFKTGNPSRAAEMLRQASQSPSIAAALQDPNSRIGNVYRKLASGNPKLMAEGDLEMEWGRSVLNASPDRATARSLQKTAQGADIEARKQIRVNTAEQVAMRDRMKSVASIKGEQRKELQTLKDQQKNYRTELKELGKHDRLGQQLASKFELQANTLEASAQEALEDRNLRLRIAQERNASALDIAQINNAYDEKIANINAASRQMAAQIKAANKVTKPVKLRDPSSVTLKGVEKSIDNFLDSKEATFDNQTDKSAFARYVYNTAHAMVTRGMSPSQDAAERDVMESALASGELQPQGGFDVGKTDLVWDRSDGIPEEIIMQYHILYPDKTRSQIVSAITAQRQQ